jgi:hypothetical protein
MSRSHSLSLALLLALGGFSVEAKDLEKRLKGDYAFAGEATCLVSLTGFNSNFEPVGPGLWPRVFTFSIQGVRTFNGDGTGKVVARTVSLSHPFALPGTPPFFNRGSASSADLESDFTYTVSPDLTLTVITPVVTGKVLTGSRTGQAVTITNVPPFTGFVSEGLDSLTLAHDAPGIENHHFSNGDADQRICHRSRILHQRKAARP